MRVQTITGISNNGFGNTEVWNITLKLFSGNMNIHEAIKNACTEFAMTDEGFDLYKKNGDSFDWDIFVNHIPNSICKLFGFEKINASKAEVVLWDSNILDESRIERS